MGIEISLYINTYSFDSPSKSIISKSIAKIELKYHITYRKKACKNNDDVKKTGFLALVLKNQNQDFKNLLKFQINTFLFGNL